MPDCDKWCEIDMTEQQVHLQHFLHLDFSVDFWLVFYCLQFAITADWEAAGKWVSRIGELIQN